MKPYGVPRVIEIEFPDIADIQKFGMKSSTGRLANISGHFRPYIKSNHKAWVRRIWKKKERANVKLQIRKELHQ